jgi:uncharacterized hydrophobic protein (TIGR00341 family)
VPARVTARAGRQSARSLVHAQWLCAGTLVLGLLHLLGELFAGLGDAVGLFDEFLGPDFDTGDGFDRFSQEDACGLGVGEVAVGLDDETQSVERVLVCLREQRTGRPADQPVFGRWCDVVLVQYLLGVARANAVHLRDTIFLLGEPAEIDGRDVGVGQPASHAGGKVLRDGGRNRHVALEGQQVPLFVGVDPNRRLHAAVAFPVDGDLREALTVTGRVVGHLELPDEVVDSDLSDEPHTREPFDEVWRVEIDRRVLCYVRHIRKGNAQRLILSAPSHCSISAGRVTVIYLPVVGADVRLVQVTIPSGKRETVLAVLDDEGVDYVVADETSGREYAAIAYFPLPKNAVEPILESLREAGLDDETFTVVVEANTVVSRHFDELQAEYAEQKDEDRIAREELTAAAADLAPATRTYVIMTVVSAVIATAGLLLDSPAVVVGSMVIAPLVGPAMAASVGTVVNDQEMFSRGVRLQVVGLLLAVLTAAAFAVLVRYTNLIPPVPNIESVPEIRERVAPDFLSLVVALGAGVAGVVSLTSGVSTALVGVMIAVALIPPAATVGIGIAWGVPLVTLGAGVLLLINVASINVAALVVLWYSGYRPEHWFREGSAKSATVKRVAVLATVIVVLSAFLGGVTYDSYTTARTDSQLREATAEVVNTAAVGAGFDVELLDVQIEHTNTELFRQPRTLVVTVGVPPGETFSGLADRLDDRVDAIAAPDIRTEIRYVTTEVG